MHPRPRIANIVVLQVAVLPLLVLALAACGGSSSAKVASGDVAVVGSTHISLATFNALLDQAKASYKSQGRAFPKAGSTDYQTLKTEAIAYLVQMAEREQRAKDLGITVTDAQVSKQLATAKQQCCAGSEAKYQAELKKQGLTDALVRGGIKSQLIQQAIYDKITKNVTVSKSDIAAYYLSHISTYVQPESRDLRHILVKSKTLADSLYAQLKAGNDQTWCKLAKKYSQDPSSKNVCGKLTVTKGETVPAFDKVAFSQPTKVVHAPVYDAVQYKSYFIIEPLSNIKPKTTTPESKVSATIEQTLLSQKKSDTVTAWVNQLTKSFCSGSKLRYQAGYQPNPDPCTAVTSSSATTG